MKRTWIVLALAVLLPGAAAAKDDTEARRLYDLMLETVRNAKTLEWTSAYLPGGREGIVYRMRMKKPNSVRIELSINEEPTGVLVGDGETFWTWWPGGRPRYGWEHEGKRAEEYERTKGRCYTRKHAPPGRHSISHETSALGSGMGMTILEPSVFCGAADGMERFLDGVRWIGEEKIADEDCDVLEASYMSGQRTRRLWLARKDRLPRKLVETIEVRRRLVKTEMWSDVKVDAEQPDDLFAWKPPEGWVQWRMPKVEEGLLPRGSLAPDFDLPLLGGGRFHLADQRGKAVWIYFWRAG
jgi:outer membrane lipoprotein-sorting protein